MPADHPDTPSAKPVGPRTPWGRLQRSLAFRLPPTAYRRILEASPRPAVAAKPDTGWPLLTMTGRRHLSMTVEMLRSLGRAWSRTPELIVAADGSSDEELIRRALSFWPKRVTVRLPGHYLEAAAAAGRPEIAAFAQKNILGLKFAAMMHEAAQGPVFWCDGDILFFADLVGRSTEFADPRRSLYSAEDWLFGYDPVLFDSFRDELSKLPWVNSGLVWMRGDIYSEAKLAAALVGRGGSYEIFTEQTLIALATARCGSIAWDRSRIMLDDADQFTFRMRRPPAECIARHYLTPHRHLFWRDALSLRLGGRP